MNNKNQLLLVALVIGGFAPAWAQDAQVSRESRMAGATDPHAGHSPETMGAHRDHAKSEMDHESMDEMSMEGMDHGAMPGAASAPVLRDPHAYADGYDFSQFPMRHEEVGIEVGMLLVDRLEFVRAGNNTSAVYDLQAWHGGNFDRAIVKAEGDIDEGTLQEGRTEVLWGHAITPFWDAQLGARYDNGTDPGRGWLAFGVQGLAPYWFELDAAAYVGTGGRSALRVSGEYELLLTQKLILQPSVDANLYGKRDAARELDSGLSDLRVGLRLRYELKREFAPYVGIEWTGKYGGTADYARAAGEKTADTRAVAGLRFWF